MFYCFLWKRTNFAPGNGRGGWRSLPLPLPPPLFAISFRPWSYRSFLIIQHRKLSLHLIKKNIVLSILNLDSWNCRNYKSCMEVSCKLVEIIIWTYTEKLLAQCSCRIWTRISTIYHQFDKDIKNTEK